MPCLASPNDGPMAMTQIAPVLLKHVKKPRLRDSLLLLLHGYITRDRGRRSERPWTRFLAAEGTDTGSPDKRTCELYSEKRFLGSSSQCKEPLVKRPIALIFARFRDGVNV